MSEPVIATSTTTTREWGGPVLDVLRELLAGHERRGTVLTIFEKLVARNSELELQLTRMLGRRNPSEAVSIDQLRLFLEKIDAPDAPATGEEPSLPCSTEEAAANTLLRNASGIDERCARPSDEAPKPPPQPSVRTPFPEHLERVQEVIAVAEAERPCPLCGTMRECIGHDVTEEADLKPAEVFVRVKMREKLACSSCEGELVRAPGGGTVVSGGRYGPNLVAQVVIDKYSDGLPLHRQKERFARMGLPIPVSTLCDQVRWATDLFTPVWRAAQGEVLGAKVMHLDGTGLPVLVRDKQTHKKLGTGKRLGTLWGYLGGETAVYLYCTTGHKTGRAQEDIGPEDFLARRKGYTVADAATVFDASFRRDDLIECGCNMHARRYFVKALERSDERAVLPIGAFGKLYEIEEKVRALDDEERRVVREAESRPVHEALLHWCKVFDSDERPTSALGRAIHYLINNQVALMRFLGDGCVPIDNGPAERLHVRVALTRKNFLFAGSDAGGRRAAIAYTILGSCRIARVDPREYLADVLPRLARGGISPSAATQLLPAFWRDQRR